MTDQLLAGHQSITLEQSADGTMRVKTLLYAVSDDSFGVDRAYTQRGAVMFHVASVTIFLTTEQAQSIAEMLQQVAFDVTYEEATSDMSRTGG